MRDSHCKAVFRTDFRPIGRLGGRSRNQGRRQAKDLYSHFRGGYPGIDKLQISSVDGLWLLIREDAGCYAHGVLGHLVIII